MASPPAVSLRREAVDLAGLQEEGAGGGRQPCRSTQQLRRGSITPGTREGPEEAWEGHEPHRTLRTRQHPTAVL